MTAKELRAQMARRIQQAREVLELAEKEKRELTAEDRQQIDKIHAEAAQTRQQIEQLEQQEEFEGLMREPVGDAGDAAAGSAVTQNTLRQPVGGGNGNGNAGGQSAEQLERARSLAFRGWCMSQANLQEEIRPEMRAAMQRFDLGGDRAMDVNIGSLLSEPQGGRRIDEIRNALSVGSDTAGGFTVPTGFITALEIAMLAYGGMRQVSTIMRTATGNELPYPTTNDTSNEGIELSENAAADTDGTDVDFGNLVLRAYNYSSKFVRVSNVLIRDSAFSLEALLGRMLGERLGRIQNRRCTTGDGAAKAEGITVASTEGKEAASATALDADEIIELIHSVDPSYRSQGSRFMMHDSVFLQVTLLKDGEGNYLHQPGLADGSDLRVRGYPVTINQHMASSVAASAKVMLFGLLSKYLIREVSTMRLRRLVERFAEYDQTAFLALLSFDGGLLDAGTHPVKHMVMAAA